MFEGFPDPCVDSEDEHCQPPDNIPLGCFALFAVLMFILWAAKEIIDKQ